MRIIVIKSRVAVPEVGNWFCFHVISIGQQWLPGALREILRPNAGTEGKKPARHQRKPRSHVCQHQTRWFTCWLRACCVLDIVCWALSTCNRDLWVAPGRASLKNGDLSYEKESGFSCYSLSEGETELRETQDKKRKVKEEEEGERVGVGMWCQLPTSQDPPFLALSLKVYFLWSTQIR